MSSYCQTCGTPQLSDADIERERRRNESRQEDIRLLKRALRKLTGGDKNVIAKLLDEVASNDTYGPSYRET